MKTVFYEISNDICKLQCFKLSERDEVKEPAYEIVCTNIKTGESDSIEAYQPQAAIALADEVMKRLSS
jgi:hypothetical protein